MILGVTIYILQGQEINEASPNNFKVFSYFEVRSFFLLLVLIQTKY